MGISNAVGHPPSSRNLYVLAKFFAGFAGSTGTQIPANNKPSNARTHVLSHLVSFDQLQAICLCDFFSQLSHCLHSGPKFWSKGTRSIGSSKNLHPSIPTTLRLRGTVSNGTIYLGEMSLVAGLDRLTSTRHIIVLRLPFDGILPAVWLTRWVLLNFFCAEHYLCGDSLQ